MKKNFFAVITSLVTFTTLTTMAGHLSNPLIRICNLNSGEFVEVKSEINGLKDQFALCAFNSSLIGSMDLVNYQQLSIVPLSIKNYLLGDKSCLNEQSVTTLDGIKFEVCKFNDGSIIDTVTLSLGKEDESNYRLNEVLNKVFNQ